MEERKTFGSSIQQLKTKPEMQQSTGVLGVVFYPAACGHAGPLCPWPLSVPPTTQW